MNGTNGQSSSYSSASSSFEEIKDAALPGTIPIAICGIGLRLSGGIRSPDDFWDLLVNGRDARGPIPGSRYNAQGFDGSLDGKERVETKFGYYLEDDLSRFDPSLFSMTQRELERCDPQQRLLLEVTRECLEDAGEVGYRGKPIGCYVGTFGEEWQHMQNKDAQQTGNHLVTGAGDWMLANRVSYEYNLCGPSMVIRTACSASLIALHEACRALQFGDASAAVVAGTNLILGPALTMLMTSEGVLSPDGSCKSFDASANGYARAEGITAVFVKRLTDAIRDGNPIRAVIRGTAANSDGKSPGMLVPKAEALESLMRKVYTDAGLNPSDTAFVECHGTGTSVGDPIETSAVGQIFGADGVYIGSVKPNIGHCEGSAGLASLIKAVLALENRTIPPNIKFNTPNPKIPFGEKRLTVPTTPTPFPPDKAERISVNSFGIGGSNTHVIIDSFPGIRGAGEPRGTARRPELLILSANTQNSLKRQVELYQDYASQHPSAAYDIAYTLALRRERLQHRAFLIKSGDEIVETSSLLKVPGKSHRKVTMIFTGQGSQWVGIGRGLFITNAEFREDIHYMDDILRNCAKPPRWTLEAEILKPVEISDINKASISQPLCTALQIAVFRQFKRLGVVPTAVVGHSSGEIAAAYAAGYISLAFAIKAAYYRGLVSSASASKDGSMAAIGLGAKEVEKLLPEGVVVACENSPQSTTISGDRALVEQAVSKIKADKPETFARLLKVDMAYHSHHMEPLAKEYLQFLKQEKDTSHSSPTLLSRSIFMSSVTTKIIDNPTDLGPEYWVANLVSPVRFDAAVKNLFNLRGDSDILLEIGPHGALAGPLRQICAAGSWQCNYVAAQNRGSDSTVSFLAALGRLFQENVDVDFGPLFTGGRVVSGLPSYAWDHSGQSFWNESRLSADWRHRKYPHHCILGVRDTQSPDAEPLWRNVLHLDDASWLVDHKVAKDVIFPFAGYVAIAGEAVRQVAGADAGSSYQLRHVVARTALVLHDSKPVEIITTLRRKRLTDSDESQWYEFNVTSYSGSAWIKHCTGEVKHIEAPTNAPSWLPKELPRKLSSSTFYESMEHNGFVYGPEFQSLTDITTSATEQVAEAKLVDTHNHISAPFTLHPVAIDGCLQLLMIAVAQGLCRNFDGLYVPTSIEELVISRGATEMHARAWTKNGDLRQGEVEFIADGRLALRMRGLQLAPLEDDDETTDSIDKHAAAHVQWLPDFDFVDHRALFAAPKPDRAHLRMQQELSFLCMIEEVRKVEGIEACQPHFAKLRDWMKKEIADAAEGKGSFPLVDNATHLLELSTSAQQDMIESHLEILKKGYHSALSIGIKRVCDHAAELFAGSRETIDVLMQGNLLTEIYNHTSFGYGDFVRLLSNSRPNLRILEVGAGTGGTTELILRDLVDEGGFPAYSVYTFTDVSSGFLVKARERFSYAPNMEYKVLDISKSPLEQGFEGGEKGSYDLILAANVVHATPFIRETLGNIKSLLKPDGMLVLTELLPTLRTANYMFGHFAGWWLGEADARPSNPLIPVERWDEELKGAGFAGVDSFVSDDEEPYNQIVTMVSRPQAKRTVPNKRVTLLCEDENSGVARTLNTFLQESGWEVTPCRLTSTPPPEQDIIACLNLESNWFVNLTEEAFANLQTFAKAVGQQKILWLARPVQIRTRDPRLATFIGVARTLRAEKLPGLCTLEIETNEPQFADLVLGVFEKVRTQEDVGTLGPDREFAVENSQVCIPRYHPFSLTDRLKEGTGVGDEKLPAESKRTALNVGKVGSMETLHWIDEPLPPELPEDHVEIETRAVGLNFRDVVLARGIIESGTPGRIPLGYELSGIIRRVGSAVTGLAPGDRVMALCNGCLATRNVAPAEIVMKVPDDLSFESAATIPVCFGTVIYSLIDIGRLEKGQSVLIHSACGGVGLAALQVSKMLGAEIFATVGSEKKVEYLINNFGIPRTHIFNSRDASFAEGIMRETDGRGVDLVLNSLSGELLHESWRCVAKFGIMIELGLRDSMGSGSLSMLPFAKNRSYHGVNLSEFRERPKWLRGLLSTFVTFYKEGLLRPIEPVATFDAKQISRAFRHLEDGDHLGKVTVSFPPSSSNVSIEAVPQRRHIEFDPTATYLLVGGVGGLGRSIATWMVERGARSLAFLSRSAGLSDVSKSLFLELESMGCSVTAVAGRVDQMDDVQETIRRSKSPIKGVIQLAMVLRDVPIVDMEWSQWNETLAPKVDGTWNLHRAFQSSELDFFFLASSLVSVADSLGQGNYVAASMFIEAFCRYRHSLGLPASVLNIGPVRDVGFVAENAHAMHNIKAQGLSLLSEREFLDFFELSLLDNYPADMETGAPRAIPPTPWYNSTQVIMGLRAEQGLDDPNSRTMWRRDRRMGIYHNVRTEGPTKANESDALQEFLSRVAAEGGKALLKETSSLDFLAHEIGRKIYDFLLRPDEEVDTSVTLAQMGLDSLMAIELRRWFKGAFGLTLSALEIIGTGTLVQLAELVASKLLEKLESESQRAT